MKTTGLKKRGKIKYAVYVLIAALFYLLQSRAVLPELLGVRPIVLVSLAVSAAAIENAECATVYGAACGMLADISLSGRVGYFAFSLAIVCCVGQYLINRYLEITFISAELFALAAVVCIACGQWVIFALPCGFQTAWEMLVYIYAPQTLYTFAVTVPLYFIFIVGSK